MALSILLCFPNWEGSVGNTPRRSTTYSLPSKKAHTIPLRSDRDDAGGGRGEKMERGAREEGGEFK